MEVKTIGGVKVAVLGSRFDSCSADDVQKALQELIDGGAEQVLCDFSQTDYIASAGFRVLLTAAKRMENLGGGIVLCSLKPMVQEVFQTAGFTKVFEICESQDDAVKRLQNARESRDT